ncbi:MAG TPA: elongation factor G-like protein EF-G2 [Pilimelia sp.]|nr:elongation factor G-like protein EF-G2 [Pilimelia sp.]
MAQKGSDRIADVPPPAAASPAEIRNVAVVGHSGAGKTTLVEALLAAAGVITRAGEVAAGTTVCDSDPAAIAQGRSTALSCAPLPHGNIKINLLDTPGYVDFVGELRAGLRAADAALFVVSAVDGVDMATATLWQECADAGMPRAIAVTRLDHPRADWDETIALCQRILGGEDAAASVLPLSLLLPDAGGAVLGLVDQQVRTYADGPRGAVRPATAGELAAAEEARAQLLEAVIAESEDETLMDRYLAGEVVDPAVVTADLERAVARGHFHPVVPACAATGLGLDTLLDLLAAGLPSPLEHAPPPATALDGTPRPPLTCDPRGPLAAEVVRTTADPYLGRVSLVRVFSGTLRPDTPVHVAGHGLAHRGHADHDADERVAHVYAPLGAHLREVPAGIAGDLCALTRSGSAQTGDTVAHRDDPLLLAPWEMPEPLLPVAVRPANRADEDALARNLARLVVADPTMRLERSGDTGQLVLWCMGEAHADVVLHHLRAGGVAVETEAVRVPLRETFEAPARGHGRHVKQSGGHGQYAVVDLTVEPLPRGAGTAFVNAVVGGAVPHHFVPSVEKGVRAQLARGLTAGYPVQDVRVTLVDGKAHSVDSSDAAFQTAAALALRDAAGTGRLALLEPVDTVAVRVPESLVGVVMGDLPSRRARVLGTAPDAAHPDHAVVQAEVPARELLRYAVELRAMTSGSGTFTRAFARYEPMPAHVAELARKEHADR